MAATIKLATGPGRIISVQGDTSYATGGYSVPASFLPGDIPVSGSVSAPVGLNDGAAVIALWDATNQKVKFITAATGAEVANASDQSAVTVKLLA